MGNILGGHDFKSGNVRDSIRRASVKFELNDGTHAGDLVLENERLKTTLTVLNQKLKNQNEFEGNMDAVKKRNQKLEEENTDLKSRISALESKNISKDEYIE